MSATDFRQMIDIHGGDFIGVECSDGTTIEIGINGDRVKFTVLEACEKLSSISMQMAVHMTDGFERFPVWIGDTVVSINYFDAGFLLDTIAGAIRTAVSR